MKYYPIFYFSVDLSIILIITDIRLGESRVQEQVALTVMHTLWHREHNRIVQELQRLNPSWSDEELFQEGRRINTAQYQHIVYEEWLPIILGNISF